MNDVTLQVFLTLNWFEFSIVPLLQRLSSKRLLKKLFLCTFRPHITRNNLPTMIRRCFIFLKPDIITETLARVSRSLLVFSFDWRRIIMLEPILGTLSIWWLVVYANILLLLSPLVLLMIVFLPNFPILLLRRICYIPIESIWPRSIDITSYQRSFTFIIQSTFCYNTIIWLRIKLSNLE